VDSKHINLKIEELICKRSWTEGPIFANWKDLFTN
jgi:hypothetical protein